VEAIFSCRQAQIYWIWKANWAQRPDMKVEASDHQIHLLIQACNDRDRVGGWGWKSTAPKVIWFPSIFELMLDRSEKAVEFMIPTPKVPTVSTNWWGLTQQMSYMKNLGSGEEGVGWTRR
jgi:hypothetical protein